MQAGLVFFTPLARTGVAYDDPFWTILQAVSVFVIWKNRSQSEWQKPPFRFAQASFGQPPLSPLSALFASSRHLLASLIYCEYADDFVFLFQRILSTLNYIYYENCKSYG
jgi:hypothetical protein